MQEEGKLFSLKNKWWKEMYKGESCEDDNEVNTDESSSELGIENVGGVFLVLTVGILLSFLISLVEFLWNVHRISVDELVPFSVVFWTELKFSLNLFEETKPVHQYESNAIERDFKVKSETNSVTSHVTSQDSTQKVVDISD